MPPCVSKTFGEVPLFFESLAQLDLFYKKPHSRAQFNDVLGYIPRSLNEGAVQTEGKLLVCHDYKGGYTEYTSPLCYTFNFWEHCETFIYFSHKRVTIPPAGWINAAHRQGVKILGVLIFEHAESAEDLLRLLLGDIPRLGPASASIQSRGHIPISSHYAQLLAQLARERGFDGYLLNVEYPLQGGPDQVRALQAWISLLDREMRRKVGPFTQTIWYDSVIINGQLRWQDRLNSLNLPFYIPSTGFFTNYTWPSTYPSLNAQYMLGLDPSLTQATPKSLQDIFVGIDVWGRGSHGGGGFGCYKALEHIDPRYMGLSVALFGPAWSWESEQDKDGWDWEEWWAYERKLWLGPESSKDVVQVPSAPLRENEPPCTHGDFKPITTFFRRQAPPNASELPLYTSFSPGIGFSWFVEGKRVMHKAIGWTDIDKQTSLGDLLWPRPAVAWDTITSDEPLPLTSTSLSFTDAYNGGSSVTLSLRGLGSSTEESSFRCFWIPIQSLAMTPGLSYDGTIVLKTSCSTATINHFASVKLQEVDADEPGVDISNVASEEELPFGWYYSRIRFVAKPQTKGAGDVFAAIGLILSITTEDPSLPYDISVQIGQLAVFPTSPSSGVVPYEPRMLWAECEVQQPDVGKSDGETTDDESLLVITWDTCICFTNEANINMISSTEDPNPPWRLDHSPNWYPHFLYFNIYMIRRHQSILVGQQSGGAVQDLQVDTSPILNPEDSTFIGTSGLDGSRNRLMIDRTALPDTLRSGPLRIYVRGITDRGELLSWEKSVFADVDL